MIKKLFDLFFVFARIGGFTFGGGYAMLPLLQKEVVEKRNWVTEEELMDYYAIGQCTPGIIAVNTATFVGAKTSGTLGGVFATLGVVFPSIVIITIISMFLKNFAQYEIVQHIFNGIRVCVCILILDAAIKLGKKSVKNLASVIIFGIVLVLSLFTKVPVTILVLLSGFAGVLIGVINSRKCKKNEEQEGGEK